MNSCWKELRSLFMVMILAQLKIFDAIADFHQVLKTSLPAQILHEQPTIFDDLHGKIYQICTQWTDCWEAFEYQLKLKCERDGLPGVQKIAAKEYALYDGGTFQELSKSRSFQSCFRPGRKVLMSITFQQCPEDEEKINPRCPGCCAKLPAGSIEDSFLQW